MEGKTEEEIEMMKLMGFGSFNSTKVRAQGVLWCAATRRRTLFKIPFLFHSLTEDRHTGRFSMLSIPAAETLFQVYYVIEWRRMLGI